jgi:16S rRNA (cytidine1402-2'-O)-methyltransferase
VATPLGNPGDLSPRAAEVLASAGLVLAEDTRRAGLFFKRHAITPARVVSFYEHNEAERAPAVLAALRAGTSVALISDAGTPLLSDPGYRLVRACRQEGIAVSPVPGPSAVLAALSASGLPPHPFVFLGFLPRKEGDQRRLLGEYARVRATLVLFERKDRLRRTLETAFEVLGPRELCLARELTKVHEEFIVGRLDRWDQVPETLLGELTVVVGPPEVEAATGGEALLEVVREEAAAGGKPREVVRRVLARTSGASAKDIYDELKRLQD